MEQLQVAFSDGFRGFSSEFRKKKINYIKIKIDVMRECVSATETSSGIFTGVMLLNLTLFDLLLSSASVKNDQVSIFFFCFQDLLGKLKDAAKSVERASQV